MQHRQAVCCACINRVVAHCSHSAKPADFRVAGLPHALRLNAEHCDVMCCVHGNNACRVADGHCSTVAASHSNSNKLWENDVEWGV